MVVCIVDKVFCIELRGPREIVLGCIASEVVREHANGKESMGQESETRKLTSGITVEVHDYLVVSTPQSQLRTVPLTIVEVADGVCRKDDVYFLLYLRELHPPYHLCHRHRYRPHYHRFPHQLQSQYHLPLNLHHSNRQPHDWDLPPQPEYGEDIEER